MAVTDKQLKIIKRMIEIHPRQFNIDDFIYLFDFKEKYTYRDNNGNILYRSHNINRKCRLPFYSSMHRLVKKGIIQRQKTINLKGYLDSEDFSIIDIEKAKHITTS